MTSQATKAETLKLTTPSDREIEMTRVFDAPRHLVFDALTQPELIRRWYGPEGWSMSVCEVDLKVGGKWRFVSRQPSGKEIGQRGIYREVVPSERLVNTELWDDWDVGEVLVTTVFAERDGRTTLTVTTLFPSQEVRDALINSGMASGAAETYDKLAELLASMA